MDDSNNISFCNLRNNNNKKKKINIFCTSKIEVEEQEKGNQARKIGKKGVCSLHFSVLAKS